MSWLAASKIEKNRCQRNGFLFAADCSDGLSLPGWDPCEARNLVAMVGDLTEDDLWISRSITLKHAMMCRVRYWRS